MMQFLKDTQTEGRLFLPGAHVSVINAGVRSSLARCATDCEILDIGEAPG